MKRILWDEIYLASKEVCLSRKWIIGTLNFGKQGSHGHWPPEDIYGIALAAHFERSEPFWCLENQNSAASFHWQVSIVVSWFELSILGSAAAWKNPILSIQRKRIGVINISTRVKRGLLEGFMSFFFEISRGSHSFSSHGPFPSPASPLFPVPVGQPQIPGRLIPPFPESLAPLKLTWGLEGARREPLEGYQGALVFSSCFSVPSGMPELMMGSLCLPEDESGHHFSSQNIHKTQRLTSCFVPDWSVQGSHRFCVTFN